MKNFKMTIQYEGTRYNGWQSQTSTGNTIQGKIQDILEKMAEEEVQVHGSGRTDAGVHAKAQVAHFHLNTKMSEKEILQYVNQYLPEDIAILKVEKVSGRFHSRLNAKEKTYVYRIWNSTIPQIFERKYMHTVVESLDVEQMKAAANYFLGTHDFAAFCGKKLKKSTIRTVDGIQIERIGAEIRIQVRGNGFLYHMVRILAGTLVEVGLGQKSPDQMQEIIDSKNREKSGVLLPAQGLILQQVKYD